MNVSCECLNISVTSTNINFAPIDSKISNSFTHDSFFYEDLGLLTSCSINVQVPSLLEERQSGHWEISKCLNCEKHCFATSSTLLGCKSVLVPKHLHLDVNQIKRLVHSELYSPVFKILIKLTDLSSDEESGFDQKTILCPAAERWLTEQTALAEERVKVFSEQEFSSLDSLRKRVYKEQRAIKRLEKKSAKSMLSDLDAISVSLKKTSINEENQPDEGSIMEDSLDSEGVFLLDGFDRSNSDVNVNDDSGSDESDESASYHPRRMGVAQLAKSLPIPVPQFMEVDSKRYKETTNSSPEVPNDIAASIKALAKSIHGDSIFGELPPPRFSTHL